MTTAMGPPPPRNPNSNTDPSSTGPQAELDRASASEQMEIPMAPPPPRNLELQSQPVQEESQSESVSVGDDSQPNEDVNSPENAQANKGNNVDERQEQRHSVAVPYSTPPWSEPPPHHYYLEVLKDGAIIDQFDVNEKGAYMFGRVDLCDFVLEHPTISRFHAVLQFKNSGDAYVYDLGSTHGTFVNKNEVKKRVYVELHVGDVIRFGHSSRLYIFQGPPDLMPSETDLKRLRSSEVRQEMQDMEASLRRAKLDASLADGISWGMQEDAIEETEDEDDEITWQTYKGQLTEKQEKTREKVIKRLEKIANMKKEIDAIRAKDIAQGGLTQGQQTQIARNEQRISQIMEELESLEETLNESIRESIGARTGRISLGKKKGVTEEEEEYLSDDDEFYDRTKKPPKPKSGENQSIETADSLLDKKDAIIKQMDEKRKLLLDEAVTAVQDHESNKSVEAGDALDAYMSDVSSQLAFEKRDQVHKELSSLQSELDRVVYLLKIADPTGEAARKRELKSQEQKADMSKPPEPVASKQPPPSHGQGIGAEHSLKGSISEKCTDDITPGSSGKPDENVAHSVDGKSSVYTIVKPKWLGAVEEKKKPETAQELQLDVQEKDHFVDYKDRKKVLVKSDTVQMDQDSGIENSAPGLIIRKRKQVEKSNVSEVKISEQSSENDIKAEDAVALLLKYSRGYYQSGDQVEHDSKYMPCESQLQEERKKPRRVLGPERPSFLKNEVDFESWVPPEGQSGDGRTSLNDRYGY